MRMGLEGHAAHVRNIDNAYRILATKYEKIVYWRDIAVCKKRLSSPTTQLWGRRDGEEV
jgi:hypothetical protein